MMAMLRSARGMKMLRKQRGRALYATLVHCGLILAELYSLPARKTEGQAMIDLYAAGTSNGMRARIALEECGLAYKLHPIDLTKGEHKTPQYLALNPMGQIPVIVDNEGPGGKKITLSQSSAIMVYCAEKAGKFIPKDPAKKAAMLEAYMSASTDITPGFGSVNACVRAKDPAPYAVAGEMFKQR